MYISRYGGIPDLTGELIFDLRSRKELRLFSGCRPHGIRDIHIRDRPADRGLSRCACAFDRQHDIFFCARIEDDPGTAVRLLLSARIRSGLLHCDGGQGCHRLQVRHHVDDRVHGIFLNDRSCRPAIRSARIFIHTGRDHLIHRIKDSCHSDGPVRGHARGCRRLIVPAVFAVCAHDCPYAVPALCAGCQTDQSAAFCSPYRVEHNEHFLIEGGKQPDIAACRHSRTFSEKHLDTSCRVEENSDPRRAEGVPLIRDRIGRDKVTRRFRFKTHIALRSDLDLPGLDDRGAFRPHDIHDRRDRAGQSICVRSRYADHLFSGIRIEGYIAFAAYDLRIHSGLRKHRSSRINITVVPAFRSLPVLPAIR